MVKIKTLKKNEAYRVGGLRYSQIKLQTLELLEVERCGTFVTNFAVIANPAATQKYMK